MKQQEDGFIYELIDKYLNSTNLSLRQVANKWEISPSPLSLIKNKKRHPNIDIALKIMQANSEFNNRQNNQKNVIVRDLLYQGYFQHSSMQIEPIVSDDFQEKFVPKLVFKFPCRML